MVERIRCASLVLSVLSVGFLVSGILLLTFSDVIIKKAVKKESQLKQGTVVYKLWRDSPVPYYISIYIFDLINEVDFLNGAKPQLIERGPFVYKEQRTKTDIRIYPNGTISYRELRNYTFDRSKSSDDETYNITTVNVVYMTLVNYLLTQNVLSPVRSLIGLLLSTIEKPIMKRTVKEYLWGYRDPILGALKDKFPSLVTNDQVSVFASAVDEAQYETYLINNGVGFDANHTERIHDLGKIERFNFSTSLSIWSNQYANMINGTDSTIWHPDVSKDELVYSFMNDICRSVHLRFNQTHKNIFNIDVYRFTLPDDIFANSSDNEGFCTNISTSDKIKPLKCLPSGLFSLTPCLHLSGSAVSIPLPIIGSNPHFLATDQTVQDAILGLKPDDTQHRSYMELEPITGIVMNGSRRMQFNINVVNDSKIGAIARIQPVVYPMIWVNEHAEIDQPNANMFHKKVAVPLAVLAVLKYSFFAMGVTLFLTVIGLVIYSQYTKNRALVVVVDEPAAAAAVSDERTPLLE
ncbi:unnamed protein product [Adineta ricciae]|uniref:Lysosome membrane protein 2 n=1 Tax=Adineta ricciae TaxID=249248 RepID=A0A814BN76_ADIRI|nr:unnamed protein product [Adineta ricciae]